MIFRKPVQWVLLLALLVCAGAVYASPQLQEAKAICDQGDFGRALDLFNRVAMQDPDPLAVKEARYFIGFCKVRLQDYWGAVTAFEDFLRMYECTPMADNYALVPDALYVLGRTYEQVNDPGRAVSTYQRCVSRFPSTEFSGKCQDRLRVLGSPVPGPVYPPPGPVGPGPNPGPYYPNPADDQLIEEIVKMAKAAPTYSQQDEILLQGLNRARCGMHVLRLAQAASSNSATDEICIRGVSKCFNANEVIALAKATATYAKQDEVCLTGCDRCQTADEYIAVARACSSNSATDQVLGRGVMRAFTVDEVIRLAKATATYAKQDEICIQGVRVIRTFEDARRLAAATASVSAEQRVLDEARKILLGNPQYANNPGVRARGMNVGDDSPITVSKGKPQTAPKDVKRRTVKATANPFENLKVDKDRLTRVNAFVSAVATMKNVETKRQALKSSDLSLEIVKESMKKYNQKKNFEKAHGN